MSDDQIMEKLLEGKSKNPTTLNKLKILVNVCKQARQEPANGVLENFMDSFVPAIECLMSTINIPIDDKEQIMAMGPEAIYGINAILAYLFEKAEFLNSDDIHMLDLIKKQAQGQLLQY